MQIGFFGLLTLVFVVLKLTEVVTWSWLLVLSPMLFNIFFFIVVIALLPWAHRR